MKYVFIEKHQAEFSIKAPCRVLQAARSGWYAWNQRRAEINSRQQLYLSCDSTVLEAFHRAKPRYSALRLTGELNTQGYRFNVKTVAVSLRRQGGGRKLHGRSAQSVMLPRTWSASIRVSAEAGLLRQRPESEVGGWHRVSSYR